VIDAVEDVFRPAVPELAMVECRVDNCGRVAWLDPAGLEPAYLEAQRVRTLVEKRDALRADDLVAVGRLIESAALPGDGEPGQRKLKPGELIVRTAGLESQVLVRAVVESR
jgi:hypothetical protein